MLDLVWKMDIKLNYNHKISDQNFYKLPENRTVWRIGLKARTVTSNYFPQPFKLVANIAIELFKTIGCIGESTIRFSCSPSLAKGCEVITHLFSLCLLGFVYNAAFYSTKQQEFDLLIGKKTDFIHPYHLKLNPLKKGSIEPSKFLFEKTIMRNELSSYNMNRYSDSLEGSSYQKFSDGMMAFNSG